MSQTSPSWRILSNHSNRIIERFHDRAETAVAITAFLLQEEIAQRIQDVHLIDTGAMRSSVYAELFDRSGVNLSGEGQAIRPKSVSDARKLRSDAPMAVRGRVPESPLVARVAVAVEYAIYHEMGAPAAHIPARPFVAPSVAMHAMTLKKVMQDLIRGGDGDV